MPQSQKLKLQKMYFSPPNISKVRSVFRMDELKKKELHNRKRFNGLIKMSTIEYRDAMKTAHEGNLASLIRIESIKSGHLRKKL